MTSVANKFIPLIQQNPDLQVATVAAGCFWGVEHIYRKYFVNKGLIATEVGFTGGRTFNPSYKQVCTGETRHAEALQILFDPKKLTYKQLIEFFFRIHDPTQLNHQGPDRGTQYRSAIFYSNHEQRDIANEVKNDYQTNFWKHQIATEILPIENWFSAETYHQQYLEHTPGGYECPTHYYREHPTN